jgi:hypothetical protein
MHTLPSISLKINIGNHTRVETAGGYEVEVLVHPGYGVLILHVIHVERMMREQ